METPVRIAIVGLGYWGPNLVRNFAQLPGVHVAYVCDLDEARLEKVSRAFKVGERTKSFEKIVQDPKVDAVCIATPVATHRKLGEQALLAGKHVWVEKPLAQTVEDAEALVAIARKRDLRLMVDHTFVYTPAVRKIRELVDSGELGEVLYLDSVRVNLGLFQADTNVLWDLGPHDFSIAQYVLGKTPRQVSAIAARHVEGEFENMVYVTARYSAPGSLVAHFHENWLAPVKLRSIMVGGSRRMVVYDELDLNEKVKVYDRGIDVKKLGAEEKRRALVSYRLGDLWSPRLEQTEALSVAADDFVQSILKKRAPVCDGEAGLAVVRALAAAQRSLEKDGAFVDV